MHTCLIHIADPCSETGELTAPAAGTLVLTIASPRPLRLHLGDRLILDEGLWWRRYERVLRAVVVVPVVPAGQESIVRAHDHAWRMLRQLRRAVDPRSGLPNDYIGTSLSGFANEIFRVGQFVHRHVYWHLLDHRVGQRPRQLPVDGRWLPRSDGTAGARN